MISLLNVQIRLTTYLRQPPKIVCAQPSSYVAWQHASQAVTYLCQPKKNCLFAIFRMTFLLNVEIRLTTYLRLTLKNGLLRSILITLLRNMQVWPSTSPCQPPKKLSVPYRPHSLARQHAGQAITYLRQLKKIVCSVPSS
jgi:hypothetical protein